MISNQKHHTKKIKLSKMKIITLAIKKILIKKYKKICNKVLLITKF